jgi:mono/diheme cytochrome c family protein
MVQTMSHRSHAPVAALPLLLLTVLSGAAAADPLVERGRVLVEANCSRCHTVGREDQSNHPKAPPFRDLGARYPLEALEEAFVEGIVVGHPDMPEFIASPAQIAAILAYIGTLAE